MASLADRQTLVIALGGGEPAALQRVLARGRGRRTDPLDGTEAEALTCLLRRRPRTRGIAQRAGGAFLHHRHHGFMIGGVGLDLLVQIAKAEAKRFVSEKLGISLA